MAGGWSDAKVEKMRNTQLPETLKCIGCNRSHSLRLFSNAQLARLKGRLLYSNGPNALANHNLRCRYCTGELSEEITCVSCRKLKVKEHFYKAQRHNHDTATCINCITDAVSSRPWEVNGGPRGSDDEYDDEEDEDDDDNTTVGARSIAGGVPVSTRDGGDEANETSSMSSRPSLPSSMGIGRGYVNNSDEEDLASVPGGTFLEDDPSQHGTSSIVSSLTAIKHSQASTSSRQASVQGDYGWQLKENRGRPRPAASSKPGKWAKIRAYNPYHHGQNTRVPEPSEMADDDGQHSQIGTSVAPSESYF